MKYFVYHALWKKPGDSGWNSLSGLHEGTAISLFEEVQSQPEHYCLTCVVEITKEEYEAAMERGHIG
jgi:hypothetical protein